MLILRPGHASLHDRLCCDSSPQAGVNSVLGGQDGARGRGKSCRISDLWCGTEVTADRSSTLRILMRVVDGCTECMVVMRCAGWRR